MKRSIELLAVACTVTTLAGCATTRDSILLGAGFGAGAGGAVGFAANHDSAGPALIGVATGALTGGLIGYFLHKSEEKKDPPPLNGPVEKTQAPFLTKPEVQSIWVPDKIEDDGRRYIEGHRVFLIEKQSSFSQ